MNTSINAVGFTLEQKQSDMVDSKLKRISYADDLIVDLIIKRCSIKDIFSSYNIISALTLGMVIAIYLWGNVSLVKPVSSSLRIQSYHGR